MLNYLGLPMQASTHAAEIDHMIGAGALADAGAVRRLGRVLPLRAVPVPQGRQSRRRATPARRASSRRALEVGVAVVEVVLLVFYAIPAWATRVSDFPAESEAVVVRVVAEQFAWNIALSGRRRPVRPHATSSCVAADNPLGLDRTDPDAKDDITTINQLNLPVDRPVLVHLSSKDVIHSFGLFEMRVKQDAIPGHGHPGLVHPEPHRRLRDRLLAAVRPRPLPDARLRDHPERRRLPDFLAEEAKLLAQ